MKVNNIATSPVILQVRVCGIDRAETFHISKAAFFSSLRDNQIQMTAEIIYYYCESLTLFVFFFFRILHAPIIFALLGNFPFEPETAICQGTSKATN